MKVRLAKKIMSHNSLDLFYVFVHKYNSYWVSRLIEYDGKLAPIKQDHRITQAIRLTKKKEVRNDSTRAD